MADVTRKLKVALFDLINDPTVVKQDAYYGGVLVDTPDGYRMAYLRLTFEKPTMGRADG